MGTVFQTAVGGTVDAQICRKTGHLAKLRVASSPHCAARGGLFLLFAPTPGSTAVGLTGRSPNRLPHLQLVYGEGTRPDMRVIFLPSGLCGVVLGLRAANNWDQETNSRREDFTLVGDGCISTLLGVREKGSFGGRESRRLN